MWDMNFYCARKKEINEGKGPEGRGGSLRRANPRSRTFQASLMWRRSVLLELLGPSHVDDSQDCPCDVTHAFLESADMVVWRVAGCHQAFMMTYLCQEDGGAVTSCPDSCQLDGSGIYREIWGRSTLSQRGFSVFLLKNGRYDKIRVQIPFTGTTSPDSAAVKRLICSRHTSEFLWDGSAQA